MGRPEPQGSSRAFINGAKLVVTSANKKLKPWRAEVSATAIDATNSVYVQEGPIFGKSPVTLEVICYFIRPASVSVKKRPHMTTKPDGDKLLRAVNDALTGILFHDDSQVVDAIIRKRYGTPERAEIRVTLLPDADILAGGILSRDTTLEPIPSLF